MTASNVPPKDEQRDIEHERRTLARDLAILIRRKLRRDRRSAQAAQRDNRELDRPKCPWQESR